MPVLTCTKDGSSGHKWGSQGVCFIGSDSRAKAAEVGRAIFAQEKRMNRIEILKAISEGELTKSDLDRLFSLSKAAHPEKKKKKKPEVRKEESTSITQLLSQLKNLINKADTPAKESTSTLFTSTPNEQLAVIKSVDEEQGLVTAIVLRPDVADLHGDIYDAGEVEKACFNFNVRCRQTNVQHVEMADFEVVESYVAKSGFELGAGEVIAGDWVATMKLDPSGEHFAKVKSGDFTGFSIGCKASVENI